MMHVEVPPGASTGEAIAHEGEESHLVIKGTVLAEQGEDYHCKRRRFFQLECECAPLC